MPQRRGNIPACCAEPPVELADVHAIKALAAGTADENQQKRAIRWILNHACGTTMFPYVPGTEGGRDTNLMLGRHFVARSILSLINMPAKRMRKQGEPAGEQG